MSQFRFEKHQVPARLLLSTAATVRGRFFVVTSMTHGGPERVGDLLNAEDGFFPFQHDDGTTGLYNPAHVVLVTLPDGPAEEELEPDYLVARRRTVTITLTTGSAINGTAFVSGPVGRERLSDYVRASKRFWYISTLDGTLIVNATHIVALVEETTE